jgi:pyrroloquinoline quinone biosynthesis protein D
MIGAESVVRLAAKARLRFDRHAQKHMVLYPERGLVLSDTAADVVTLCVEPRAVAAIVDALAEKYDQADRETIRRDVIELLQGLADKGLVEVVA